MTSFLITFSSNTAQTLIDGETGVIGTSGTLVVAGPQAIGVVDDTSLAIYGTLTSLDGDAVGGPAAGVFNMVVTKTGQVTSLGDAGIDVSATISADLRNSGLISGTGAGVIMNTADAAASIRLTNTGTIESIGSAIILGAGAGIVRIVNTGTILTGGSPDSNAISAGGQVVVLQQSGEVMGNVRLTAVAGATLVNTGLIDGDVVLGAINSNDTFRNLGGTVTGTIFGGSGNDTYIIDNSELVLSDSTGTDTVNASVSYRMATGIETLVLTGHGDVTGTGTGLANTITGNDGDNTLAGLSGADTLDGGNGNDILLGGNDNDTLRISNGDDRLFGGLGRDVIQGGVETISVDLSAGTVRIGQNAQTATGIEDVNGSSDDDFIVGDNNSNRLNGSFGFDSLFGGGNNDSLDGATSGDLLDGGLGFDTLTGGAGRDTLRGGGDNDRFIFNALSESPTAAVDVITDFNGTGDLIDLSAIDANGATAGDGNFLFGGASFLAVGIASIRVVTSGGNTFVEIRDKDGAAADMRIELTGLPTLTAADFVL